MSRQDSHQDFEYPAALRPRSDGSRDHPGGGYPLYTPSSMPYSQHDRRPMSSSAAAYPAPSRANAHDDYAIGVTLPLANRNNASTAQIPGIPSFASFTPNHTHRGSSSPPNAQHHHHLPAPSRSPPTAIYHTPSHDASEPHPLARPLPQQQQLHTPAAAPLLPASNSNTSRATLWWCDLEPWMDEEYARQVCSIMGWDPVNIKVPHAPADAPPGQPPANNPGYCFLTFPSHAHAAAVLAQVNAKGKGGVTMPNSARPFVLNWASSVPAPAGSPTYSGGAGVPATGQQPYQKEYSIFVGDLAPETSNSDLVAVFRNPVLGLRNDREPKFIRPFTSCKSAKIMLDPATGVSRGYGFVRFTDEADQQRALIEMHGLYCLSRPMRISPATAKHKGSGVTGPQFEGPAGTFAKSEQANSSVTIALPVPSQTASVSAPIAATPSSLSLNSNGATPSTSGSSLGGSNSSTSISSNSNSSMTSAFGSASSAEDAYQIQQNILAQLSKQYGNDPAIIGQGAALSSFYDAKLRQTIEAQRNDPAPRFQVSEEPWRHSSTARTVLGNLIGPNGEQLTSNDPYNTTVFVGGLSPLISEETLRTFFAPFGDIHYVKVPVGKHCGFVQFVRKADAERAIEKMQGFPIGGSRIRLSWGRSQYKAAQAAAQAAQATLQNQYNAGQFGSMTQQQALQLLEKFASQNYQPERGLMGIPEGGEPDSNLNYAAMIASGAVSLGMSREDMGPSFRDEYNGFIPRAEIQRALSSFSPFSPDPNLSLSSESNLQNHHAAPPRLDALPHPSKAYAPGFLPVDSTKERTSPTGLRVSPTSSRPNSASRYGFADVSDPPAPLNRAPGRAEAPISRPSSGQTVSPSDTGRLELGELGHSFGNMDLSGGSSGQFHLSASSSGNA
ncbi:hypothetical protein D9611_013527 [Ephemerocybe angulata]|uniref:RRM domain-containing protein n=1 Tax=Ephemerocybe angulata TaxID=980116 RepID=A0A8H5C4I7_9AGAR|nr:hypothetical protein D9611_013527 [Tulosesus angulatus]